MKIAAVILNSVQHDTRVIKEAESLLAAGHDVRIFGVQDNVVFCSDSETPQGVHVRLVRWRPLYLQRALRVHGAALLLIAALAVVAGLTVAGGVWLLRMGWQSAPQFTAGVVAGGVLFLLLGQRWFLQQQRFARQLRAHQLVAPAPENDSLKRRILVWGLQAIPSFLAAPWDIKKSLERMGDIALRLGAMRHLLLQEIAAYGPDAVHCHDVGALPLGLACKRLFGCKVVYDSHELHADVAGHSFAGRLITVWRERQAASLIDACITVNPYIAAVLQKRYPELPQPVVICNATRALETAVVYDGRLHQTAGLELQTRILLYQGGFAVNRGLMQLVQAALLLPEGWSVVFMGWGRLEERLRQQAQRIDPRGQRVCFIPPAPQVELPAWTAGAALGIIPYENVGLNHWLCSPNKLWEYPQAGVPILASPFPFLRSLVEGQGLGWLLAPSLEPEAIAAGVAAVTDQELAAARKRCLEFIAQDNWNRYAVRLQNLYGELQTSG